MSWVESEEAIGRVDASGPSRAGTRTAEDAGRNLGGWRTAERSKPGAGTTIRAKGHCSAGGWLGQICLVATRGVERDAQLAEIEAVGIFTRAYAIVLVARSHCVQFYVAALQQDHVCVGACRFLQVIEEHELSLAFLLPSADVLHHRVLRGRVLQLRDQLGKQVDGCGIAALDRDRA